MGREGSIKWKGADPNDILLDGYNFCSKPIWEKITCADFQCCSKPCAAWNSYLGEIIQDKICLPLGLVMAPKPTVACVHKVGHVFIQDENKTQEFTLYINIFILEVSFKYSEDSLFALASPTL